MKVTARLALLGIGLSVAIGAVWPLAAAELPRVERIIWVTTADHERARLDALKLHLTIEDFQPSGFRARATDEQIERLQARGYEAEIIWDDARDRAAHEKSAMQDNLVWTSYATLVTHLQQVAAAHPDICRLHDLGLTVQNRHLYAMEFTTNPDTDDPSKAEVRFAGNIHGDEYMSYELMRLMIDYLADNYNSDPDVTFLLQHREIWIQPSINPDGHELGTRYNAHSLDLNRNQGYFWNYEGSHSFSEPETTAFRAYSIRRNFSLSLSYHGEAEYINYVWNFSPNPTPDEALLEYLSTGYQSAQLPGYGYEVTNGWDWYQTNGDTNDWSYGCRGDLDWTIETPGYSFSELQHEWDNNREAMLYIAHQAGYGLQGVVTDAATGEPLEAIITVAQSPWPVYTDPVAGDYHRVLRGGTYAITVWANGYSPAVVGNIVVPDQGTATQNVALSRNYNVCALHVCSYDVTDYYLSDYTNQAYPHFALGPRDNVPCSLGQGCELILDTGDDNEFTNGPGNDLTVYEADVGDGDEGYSLYGGATFQGPWVLIGQGVGTHAFDLAASGLTSVRYLRILDDGDGSPSGAHPGFDLDAIEGVQMVAGCGIITLDKTTYVCDELLQISVIDEDLNTNPQLIETAAATIWSASDPMPHLVVLTEASANSSEFDGAIQLSESQSGPGYLLVHRGDVITAQYHDGDCEGSPLDVTDTAQANCPAPVLSFRSYTVDDSAGNGDGIADPGEDIVLPVTIANSGDEAAANVAAQLSTASLFISITNDVTGFPAIMAGGLATSQPPHLAFHVDEATPSGTSIEFALSITADDFTEVTDYFRLSIGLQPALVIDDCNCNSPQLFAAVLANNGFVVTSEDAAVTNPATWNDYSLVVWSSGNSSDPVSSATQQTALINFINGGGRLLIEGGETCYSHTSTPFATTVLHISGWLSDYSGNLQKVLVSHPVASSPYNLPATITCGYTTYYDQDACQVDGQADRVFGWTSVTASSVIAFDPDHNPVNGGQIVFCSFNVDKLDDGMQQRDHLIINASQWLTGIGTAPTPLPTATRTPTRTPSATPTATPTIPTLTPTASATPPPSPTTSTSPSPSATATLIPSVTGTPSQPPFPTNTPSPTPPPVTPSPSATPLPYPLDMDIYTNAAIYFPNDHFLLSTKITNSGTPISADEYIVLDVYGNYWFWPTWTQQLAHSERSFASHDVAEDVILDFTWPRNAGAAAGIKFWAALLESASLNLLSNVGSANFDYSE